MSQTQMKALIFDLDDTLVVEKASAAAAFLATGELAARRYGLDPHALHATVRETCRELWHHHCPARPYAVAIGISSWEALWSRFAGDNEHLAVLRAWAADYRCDAWHHALQAHGVDDIDLACELAETYPAHRRQRHVVYDDVRLALERLKQTHRLALLTNGASDLQREKLAGAGIDGYFEEILVAGDIGVAKPHPRMFETLLARLDVAPHETVMLGDSQSKDIQGAQAVGMKAIWVNREHTPRREGITPDLEVVSLVDLRDDTLPRTVFRVS
ncbi:MAG: HAD family hydrolase [Phycisphaerales bacterium]|nr:MAG: HAD family hydrolase [Phycisphaerales bacterium]